MGLYNRQFYTIAFDFNRRVEISIYLLMKIQNYQGDFRGVEGYSPQEYFSEGRVIVGSQENNFMNTRFLLDMKIKIK